MARKVIIINGEIGAGKTTFVSHIVKQLVNVRLFNYRSELAVIAKKMGWRDNPLDVKRESFLTNIYDIWHRYNDGIAKAAYELFEYMGMDEEENKKTFIIITRSPKDISDIIKVFTGQNIFTVLIYRKDLNNFSKQTQDYKYDLIVNNNGTIKDLEKEANIFINKYIPTILRLGDNPIVEPKKRKTKNN